MGEADNKAMGKYLHPVADCGAQITVFEAAARPQNTAIQEV